MKGDTTFIFNFFSQTTRFRIPIYQRPYSWKKEQCEQLFKDIEACASGARNFHFFGSIVSVMDGRELVLIDGQQRIATISLLLLAVRHVIEKFKRPCNYENNTVAWLMGECILERTYPPNPDRHKLVPIDTDLAAYRQIVSGATDIPRGHLTDNYRFFVDALIKSPFSLDQILQGIGKLAVIAISMDQSENPQLVFESINSTGLNLSEGDKIRNFVLMDLDPESQKMVFRNYWASIEQATDRKDGSDGIGLFIRDFLTMKTGEVPRLSGIYEAVKRYCNEIPTWKTDRKGVLQEWTEAARQYEHLLRPETIPDAGVSWRMFNINRQEVLPAYPFLLHVFLLHAAGRLTTDSLDAVLGHADSYVFRRLMCGLPTNSLNKVFKDLAKNIEAVAIKAPYEEKMAFALAMKSGNSRIPDNSEFTRGMIERDVYDMHIKNRAYLFARLEHGLSRDAPTMRCSDAVWQMIMEKKYTIEHVMPQSLTKGWRDELGEDSKEIHAKWLHRLANLTLSAYNSELGNKSFDEKSGRSFGTLKSQVVAYMEAQHHIWLTEFIARQTKWTAEEMKERARLLASRALEVWPLPSYSFIPPDNLEYGYSLLSHASGFFTGAKPVGFVLGGESIRVSTWRELAIRACQRLDAVNHDALVRFATEAAGQGLEGHLSTKETEGATKIAENLFLQTLGSAWDHCQFLRKVLQSCKEFGDLELRFSEPIGNEDGDDANGTIPRPAFSCEAFQKWIDSPINKLSFSEFREAMQEAFRAGGNNPICGIVVFREDVWDEKYPVDGRTYVTFSDYYAFNPKRKDNRFDGWALDGTDNGAHLDEYFVDNGVVDAEKIEYCYIPTHEGKFIRLNDPLISSLVFGAGSGSEEKDSENTKLP